MAIVRKGNKIVSPSQLSDGVVTNPKIANNAVTTNKIADNNVILNKLESIAKSAILDSL